MVLNELIQKVFFHLPDPDIPWYWKNKPAHNSIKQRSVTGLSCTHLLDQSRWFIISSTLFAHPGPSFGTCWGPLCNNGPLRGCKINAPINSHSLSYKGTIPPPNMLRHKKVWRYVPSLTPCNIAFLFGTLGTKYHFLFYRRLLFL